MATITVSNQIDAPVAEVFERFTDLDGSPTRVAGIKAIEMLTTGPFGPKTRWRETREVLGRLDTAEMEVTAYEKNRTYTITHHKLAARIETVFTFQSLNGGTRVNVELNLWDRACLRVCWRPSNGRLPARCGTCSARILPT